MTVWRWFGSVIGVASLAILAGALVPQAAQGQKDDKKDGDKLVWKAFDPKTVFYQKLVTNTTQDMKVMGQDIQQKQEQTFFIKWTGQDKNKEGYFVVTQEIVGVKMKIEIGGNTITYDSSEEKQPANPMSDFFKALLTLKLTLTIDPADMTVKNIEGQDEFVKKLGGTNPQMEPLLKNILSKEALQQMAEPTWGALPTKAVKTGDTWTRKSKLNLGPIGTYATDFDYKLEKSDGKTDTIGIKATLKYTAPTDKAGLPFTIKSATLESKEGTGTATFDRAKGRFTKSEMTMKLKGDLKIEVGGMETDVALDQSQTATVETQDEPFVKTKEAPKETSKEKEKEKK